jgi:lipopolysaccharide transport system permease protein
MVGRGKELKAKKMITHLLAPLRLVPTLARHRFLLGQLAWRAFASRYAGSYLGWLWTPLSTLIQFALFMAVFSVILEIKIEGLGIDLARRPAVGFGVYLITGLVPFLALNDAVLRAARVFRSHASLVQRVRMPAEVLVLGDVFGALLHHAISFAVVLGICVWRGHTGIANLPWIGVAALLFTLWVVGLSLTASVLGAALPDVPEGLALVMQVLFYGAPIVYPLAMVSDRLLRNLITANPLTPLVDVARSGLISSAPPSAAAIAYVLAAGVVLVLVGSAALDRWRFAVADLV